MAIFFGCLVAYGEVDRAPQWLIWPAFAVMVVGVGAGLLIELRGRRGQRRR
jgi:hypothetical protein